MDPAVQWVIGSFLTLISGLGVGIFLRLAFNLSSRQAKLEGQLQEISKRIEENTPRFTALNNSLTEMFRTISEMKPADVKTVNVRIQQLDKSIHDLRDSAQAMHSRLREKLRENSSLLSDHSAQMSDFLIKQNLLQADSETLKKDLEKVEEVARFCRDYVKGLISQESYRSS